MAEQINWIWYWYYCIRNIEYDIIQRTIDTKNINLFNVSSKYFISTNILEMIRKMETAKVGEDLYEIIKKLPIQKFTQEVTGEYAEALKRYYGVEKILKFPQTQEYLFVNLIEELQIQTNDNKETSESN